MAKNEFEARLLARIDREVSNFRATGTTPFEQRLQARMMMEGMPEEERRGFFERLGNLFLDPDVVAARDEGAGFLEALQADVAAGPFSPRDVGQLRVVGAGIADPILGGAQAIAQIPGLFTDVELPTDRAANYLERLRLGLVTDAEEAAIVAGIDPQSVADAHLMGEMVGFTAPVVASLKAARLITGIRGPALSLQRNFMLDTAAGLIFGSTLLPEEELSQRGVAALRESALFGVGGLMINGLVFAATGMKFARANQLAAEGQLAEDLGRIARGERVVIGDDAADIAQLMSEEGFLASSPEAYALLENQAFDTALVQGIRGTAEAGLSRGFVRNLGDNFPEVASAIERFRVEFPNLKFDAIKNADGGFDVHFGLTGLNNQQRAQLAREGRYAGQMVQKGDAVYSYVRRGRVEGSIIVRTVDGRTVALKERGVTTLPTGIEEVPLPTAGQALYEDFRQFTFGKIREAAAAGGGLSETDIVRFIRQGQLGLTDDGVRVFESPGAITHPSELGFSPGVSHIEFVSALPQDVEGLPAGQAIRIIANKNRTEAGEIWSIGVQLDPTPGTQSTATRPLDIDAVFAELSNDPRLANGVIFTESLEETNQLVQGLAQQLDQTVGVSGLRVDKPIADVESFIEAYLQRGAQSGGLLEPEPIRKLDDAFEAWLKARNLSPSATDVEAFRQNFFQRLRNDIWDLVPEEDIATMRRIQDETFRLIDAEELPFEVLAGSKGFHVERPPTGEVVLRDINTGARLTFASEEVAENAVRATVRSEKDSLFDFLTPGHHGGQAFTVGFDPTDGVFTFDTNISPDEMFKFLPNQTITNRRDFMATLEDVSGVPLFTEGFAKIDEGLLRVQERLTPISSQIARMWKGINRNQRKQVAEFWTRIEGSDLSGVELTRAARAAGLTNRQISALNQARRLFDFGAEQMGLPESRFISNYYSRIRPQMLKDGRINPSRLLSDDPIAAKEFEFWAEMQRTGELSQVELDPEIVMHKYFRSLFYAQEVRPFENNVRRMMSLRIRDLTPTQQQTILQRSLPGTTAESFVFPQEVRGMLQEYINNVRGDSRPGFAAARRFGVRLFGSVGIDIDPRVVDELYNILMSLPYGAAIGLRTTLMNRNATQSLWTMYTRLGGKHGSESLARAVTQAGYDEALTAQAIREVTAALPEADAIFETWFASDIARGSGPLSHAGAAVIRRAVRLGRVSRGVAQKFLVPYGSGDQVNRAWAYHWQKLHTAEKLADFDAGRIDWDTFLEDGLPFFSDSIRRGFQERMKRFGREPALQWIGKQAADEAHFIYGAGASPTWMQGFFGKLAGVFGQWPLWAKQLYWNRMRHASPKQIGQFWARTIAVTGAFANMSIQTGVSMWNWVAPASLGFSGGPAVDLAITARDIWSGPLDQKANATRRLGQQVGSLALPGQLFYNEFSDALDQNDPAQAALRLTLGRAADRGNFNYDFILNPAEPGFLEGPEPQDPVLQGLPSLPGTR